jgi:L-rhamnose mutarotase
VRPCGEKYKKKTYLGILLGDLPLEVMIMHNRETKELRIEPYRNPAIFVPELKEIIWGCGSWWGEIENEEELRQISDDNIQNVWYVKMLKVMQEKKKKEQEKKK